MNEALAGSSECASRNLKRQTSGAEAPGASKKRSHIGA